MCRAVMEMEKRQAKQPVTTIGYPQTPRQIMDKFPFPTEANNPL
jgi:hypothetical protein